MTSKKNAGAKYLYIKRPIYRYLYKDIYIRVLFNGNLYRFLCRILRRQPLATDSPIQIAKDCNKPTATYHHKLVRNGNFEHFKQALVKPSAKQLTKTNLKHLKATTSKAQENPSSNTLVIVCRGVEE